MKRIAHTSKIIVFCFTMVLMGTLVSCGGDEDCDDATVCVVNNTAAVIDGCWNCNQPEISIPPGESACIQIPIGDVIRFNQFGGTSIPITASQCQVVQNIQ